MSEMVAEAVVRFRTDTTGVNPEAEGKKAGSAYSKGVLGSTKRLAGALGGLFIGEKVLEFGKSAVEVAGQEQAATSKLEVAIRKNTDARGEDIKGIEEWITKQALATGVSKEELIPAYQKLVQSSGSLKTAQRELVAAQNVSAGTGKSLTTVTQALVRANNGSTSGLSRLGLKTQTVTKNTLGLRQANIAVNTAQLAYNKTVKEHGKNSDEAKIALEKLQLANARMTAVSKAGTKTTLTLDQAMKQISGTYGGQAKTQAETFQGTQARLHVTMQELEAQVGMQLIPVLTSLASFLINDAVPAVEAFGSWINRNEGWLKPLVITIGGAVVAYKAYTTAQKIGIATSELWTKMLGRQALAAEGATVATEGETVAQGELDAAMDANPIGIVVVALGALAAGLFYAYKHSETFRNIVNAALKEVGDTAGWLWHHAIVPAFDGIVTALKVLGKAATWLWNNAFQPALHFIVTGLSYLLDLWGHMLVALGHVPGFGWAKDAGHALEDAATHARSLADAINKIPNHKTVHIDQVIVTDKSGVTHSSGGGHTAPELASGGVVRARPGGTLVRVGEAGRDEAVVPLDADPRTASGGGNIIVHGDLIQTAHDYADLVQKTRAQTQMAAFVGRRTAVPA